MSTIYHTVIIVIYVVLFKSYLFIMEYKRQGIKTCIRNIDIFNKWTCIDQKETKSIITEYAFDLLNLRDYEENISESLGKLCEYICLRIKTKWKECSRNKSLFMKRNAAWLDKEITLPENIQHIIENQNTLETTVKNRGRPRKPFEELCHKAKKRRVNDLVSTRSMEELHFAASISEQSRSLQDISTPKECTALSAQDALALCLDLDLSERKYNILKSIVNSMHPGCFPSLYVLKNAKKKILPSSIAVTELSAEVNLQELLNKTVDSISQIIGFEIASKRVTLICKWGFDGSSGHSIYKQKFSDVESTDEFIFLVALCPLQLVDNVTGEKLWVNPRPFSTLYCRPIKFIFSKENHNLLKIQEALIKKSISELRVHVVPITKIEVSYEMLFTMVDGSVCNILSGTSATSKCYICGATPKEMNMENIREKPAVQQNYAFGLSTLHSCIRCFEYILHISYRIPFKVWQIRGEQNKLLFQNRKKEIQMKFKSEMGLIIDKPKPGYGSSNDGNTARRFFQNFTLSAKITDVDENLIRRFYLILRVIASGCTINVEKFSCLLNETRQLYLKLYSWHYMPSSVHKLLVHGSNVISSFDLPIIGQLSEEALEGRHKEVRKHRLNHTRKSSRLNTNNDLMSILLLTSDPLISIKRKTLTKKHTDLEMMSYIINAGSLSNSIVTQEVLDLLQAEESDSNSE